MSVVIAKDECGDNTEGNTAGKMLFNDWKRQRETRDRELELIPG